MSRTLFALAIALAGCGGERPVGRSATAPASASSASSAIVEPDEIRRQALDRLPGVRRCYEELLARRPGAENHFEVRWHIDPDDAVSDVRVGDSTLGDAAFDNCVIAVFSTMKYPRGPADATWGFKLTPPQ